MKLHFQSRILRPFGKGVYVNTATGRKVRNVRDSDIIQKRDLVFNSKGQLLDPTTGRFTKRLAGDKIRDAETGKRMKVADFEKEKRLRTIERITHIKLDAFRDAGGRFVGFKETFAAFQAKVSEFPDAIGRNAAESVAAAAERLAEAIRERIRREDSKTEEAARPETAGIEDAAEKPFEEPFEGATTPPDDNSGGDGEIEDGGDAVNEDETEDELEAEIAAAERDAENFDAEHDYFDDSPFDDDLPDDFDDNDYFTEGR